MTDATFEEGAERPLRLWAQDEEDLKVVSALLQDCVFPVTEMSFREAKRSFALLVNRFRWEDADHARARARDFERVQTLVEFGDVTGVRTSGLDRNEKDMVLSLLAVEWSAGDDGMGNISSGG